jgi:hypothetical protein
MAAMTPVEQRRFRDLLPGHLNKTLSADDQGFMDKWTNDPAQLPPELQDEAQWLAMVRDQLRASAPRAEPELGWHELLARIEAEPRSARQMGPGQAEPAGREHGLKGWWRWLQRPALAYAMLALLVGQTALLTWSWWPQGDARLMSAAPPASVAPDTLRLDVLWHPQATAEQMQAALQLARGQVLSGPSALGLWQVAVPLEQADAAVAALRAHPAVAQVGRAP